ncbi:MAG: shikimate kinase [Dehalococcoidia bacterium]|nr:shikimate kinase [Dehalococcoidia bacterium]
MQSNIALIGFMGAGKSTVGRTLSAASGMDFIDLDTRIQQKAGMSISRIFSYDGEDAFRRIESETVNEVIGRENTVIACGGGVVLDQSNIGALKRNATIVYLSAKPSILLRRVLNSPERRPLLQVFDPASAMDSLLKHRIPLYEAAADLTIDTSTLDIEGVVKKILAELKINESHDLPKHD